MAWTNTVKHVPTPLRDACLVRDGHRCVAQMRDGSRCVETTNLKADHINGWRRGERLTVDQLQTLGDWHHKKKTAAEAAAARAKQPRPTQRQPRESPPGLLPPKGRGTPSPRG